MPQPMSKGRTGSHNFPGTAPFRSPGLCRIGTARCAVTRTGYSDRRGLGPPVRPAQMPRQRGRCRDGRVKLLRLGVQAAVGNRRSFRAGRPPAGRRLRRGAAARFMLPGRRYRPFRNGGVDNYFQWDDRGMGVGRHREDTKRSRKRMQIHTQKSGSHAARRRAEWLAMGRAGGEASKPQSRLRASGSAAPQNSPTDRAHRARRAPREGALRGPAGASREAQAPWSGGGGRTRSTAHPAATPPAARPLGQPFRNSGPLPLPEADSAWPDSDGEGESRPGSPDLAPTSPRPTDCTEPGRAGRRNGWFRPAPAVRVGTSRLGDISAGISDPCR